MFHGPARALERKNLRNKPYSIADALNGANMLLSGTSFKSEIEKIARDLAKQKGILTIGVIDHWVNYKERFVLNGVELLPDEIWVTDDEALILAKKVFKKTKVLKKKNLYLEGLVKDISAKEKNFDTKNEINILYVLEPIRAEWAKGSLGGEFEALDFFIQVVSRLSADKKINISLRPHPSDATGKYDDFISKNQKFNLFLDENNSLSTSISWANVIVGCETFAMVIALEAGKVVLTSLPPHAAPCRLPFKGIRTLSDLNLLC